MIGAEGAPPAEPPTGETSDPSARAAPAGPRLVRRVVCAYRLGTLPGDWLQTWRRLDRLLARSGFKVKASLEPLERLPEDTDVLVVPPELREAARQAAPRVPVLVTTPAAAPAAFDDLIKRLAAGTSYTAERIDPTAEPGPRIVTYRGTTRLD